MLKGGSLLNPALLAAGGAAAAGGVTGGAAPAAANPLYAFQLAAQQIQAAQILQMQQAQLQQQQQQQQQQQDSQQRKRKIQEEAAAAAAVAAGVSPILNLSRAAAAGSAQSFLGLGGKKIRAESPLDLSGNQPPFPSRLQQKMSSKMAKLESEKNSGPSYPAAWPAGFPFSSPFLAGSAAHDTMAKFPSSMASSPKTSSSSSPASSAMSPSNPLERMSEIAKTVAAKPNTTPGARHSAWQSQWINRGPQNAKDIFKCFTCSVSCPSMQDLSRHMAETGHYAPSSGAPPPPPPSTMASRSPPSRPASVSSNASSLNNDRSGQKNRDLLKEQLPVPRKLVRGQDVWLGKGEEQTKHILKCMYCGQSFRTLEELTVHMTETGHFTKVMTPEQISANNSSSGRSSNSAASSAASSGPKNNNNSHSALSRHQQHEQVNSSVLSCKTCNQSFQTLKALGEHMVQSNHFSQDGKESSSPHLPSKRFPDHGSLPGSIPPPPPSSSNSTTSSGSSNRKAKSLPVKTLLELERAQKMAANSGSPALEHSRNRDLASPPRATLAQQQALNATANCDKCGESVPMMQFIQHSYECEIKARTKSLAAAQSPPPASENRRPESASSSSAASVNDDARSAKSSGSKSILGSLEDMVNHNFHGKRPASGENPSSDHDPRSSVSPARSSPATPLKSLLLASSSPSEKETPALPSSGHNPLAALQSFCDTAEKKAGPPNNHNSPQAKRESPAGSILAFSWACNKAQVDDSVLKCHFCETPFVSKGAYRHHLSKVHFMKDNQIQEHPVKISSGSQAELKAKEQAGKEPAGSSDGGSGGGSEDSSQNKYQKYAELAKTLSKQTKTLSSLA